METNQSLLNHNFQIQSFNVLTPCLGVANRRIIKDDAITASSQLGHPYRPSNGRLNKPGLYKQSAGAWCGHNIGDWIQVDLGQKYIVTKISLQGRSVCYICDIFSIIFPNLS